MLESERLSLQLFVSSQPQRETETNTDHESLVSGEGAQYNRHLRNPVTVAATVSIVWTTINSISTNYPHYG
jgi:hypothetical protein